MIGEIHRMSARLDNRYELVAGAMSVDPAVARETAELCLVDPERSYEDYRDMAEAEAAREDGVEVVTIATPPHLHAEIATLFMERGIDVICEKPMTRTLEEAVDLKQSVTRSGRIFALTHCYTGYPMVREARALVKKGAIGAVRQVECDFPSGPFLVEEPQRDKRHWRFRPEFMGVDAILGEIGTHAYQMAHFVSGRLPVALSAHMSVLTPGRETFDDAHIVLKYEDGALGRMWLSFVAAGNEHGLAFHIYGTEGSLKWHQERPDQLWLQHAAEPARRLTPGHPDRMTPEGFHACRLREGHPDGYVLAFANLYRDFADIFFARALGRSGATPYAHFPTVEDGVDTMRFYAAAAKSNAQAGAWIEL
ncbi:MAG: Gfo/Idh/MocA family oxidoreductase [Gemmatimonadota bacterium]|nr:MAG: Gfo/Idh/MocA family oxidoreductase [Gemmatimonadota bacterium]